jgi:hypothetical protein
MRPLRTIVLIAVAFASLAVLVRYARDEFFLWNVCDDTAIDLIAVPHVCIYRAYTHEHGECDGWTLFLLTDSPEGTRPIAYFPTWPLVVAAAVLLIYAFFGIVRRPSSSYLF